MEGLLEPDLVEESLGQAEVRALLQSVKELLRAVIYKLVNYKGIVR